jgi:hypothetical protein
MDWKSAADWKRLVKRLGFEFLGPAVIAVLWMVFNWESSGVATAHIKDFGAAFFFVSWLWGQLLRVAYQQNQIRTLDAVSKDTTEVKGILEGMMPILSGLSDHNAVLNLSSMINAANTKIDNANNTLQSARNYVFSASALDVSPPIVGSPDIRQDAPRR